MNAFDKKPSDPGPVIVALSGGVDSAVAALLLKQAGHEVEALHMTNWDDEDGYCRAAEDLQDARRVAAALGIPLHCANFAAEYRERVFRDFLDEYAAGRTPNPDVLCNREIKFGVFLAHARRLGAAGIATGHYARIERRDDGVRLLTARDPAKDQTYFLHAVSAEAMAQTRFPLGEIDKAGVRRLAKRHGLPVHDKKDSTGICFIGERPFRDFLARFLPAQPGPIVTPDGETLGCHSGLVYYTVGQREGLGIGGRAGAPDAPWYVAGKRAADNTLVVVQGRNHPALFSAALETGEPHWIGPPPPALAAGRHFRCRVRIRHRQRPQGATARLRDGGGLELSFPEPQRAVAPGQYAVLYDGERCLGGARIEAAAASAPRANVPLAS